MRTLEFSVPKEYGGASLKGFLRSKCRVSARLLARLKRVPMGITVNGAAATVRVVLQKGDWVRLLLPEDEPFPEPAALPLAPLYEDNDLLVVDKPSGMPVHPSPGHDRDSLANAAAAYFLNKGERLAFRPVYRLDRDTTGALILAKNAFVAARLAGTVEKTYLAVCEGILQGEGMEDGPIGLLPGHSIQRCVSPEGVRAVTHWHALDQAGGHTLLALRLETGRTHQIRVHMVSRGNPLAGDDFYGGSRALIARQALHCAQVTFKHPMIEKDMSLVAPIPADFSALLAACGLQFPQNLSDGAY